MPDYGPNFGGNGELYNGGNAEFNNVSDTLGRFTNDITGKSAQNEFNAIEAEKARVFNSAEAQKNRDFQEYMSNTAYTRAVQDMKNAGLNPASVGGNGNLSAASTPSGSTASGSAASSSSSGSGLIGLVSNIATVAIGKALMAKFTNAGMAAADNHELVAAKIKSMAANELASARQAKLYKENLDIQRERNRALAESNKRGNDIREKQVYSQDELNKARVADIYNKHHWWSDSSDFD